MKYLIGVPSVSWRGDCGRMNSRDEEPIIIELADNTIVEQFMADYEIGLNEAWEEEKLKHEAGLIGDREGKFEWEYGGRDIEWIGLFEGEKLELPSYWDHQQAAKKLANERRARMLEGFKAEVIERKRLRDIRLEEERDARERETFRRLKKKFDSTAL